MGTKLELDLSLGSLHQQALVAYESGNAYKAIMDINEALSLDITDMERARLISLMVECYRLSSSVRAIMEIMKVDLSEKHRHDDYYRFDFPRRERGYDDEEELTYEAMRIHNDVRNLILERKYDEAMMLFRRVAPVAGLCDGIIDALLSASESDTNFNLDKYIVQVLAVLAVVGNKSDMLRLMLRGGNMTREMICSSVNFLLEEEDSNALCLVGMAFFEYNEVAISRKFFERVLTLDPIDEDALYYMTVIKLLQKDTEDKTDYWSRYKEIYKITKPPVKLLEKFMQSKDIQLLVPYHTLPNSFVRKEMAHILMKCTPKEDIDEEFYEYLLDFFKLAPEHELDNVIRALGKLNGRVMVTKLYLEVLASARTCDEIKERIYYELIHDGYEGEVCILTDRRLVVTHLTRIHKRVHKAWDIFYRIVQKNIPFADIYVPLRCGELAFVTKKLDSVIYPDEEDIGFCMGLLLINYTRRLNLNIDYFDVLRSFHIDMAEMDLGMQKYNIDDIFIS